MDFKTQMATLRERSDAAMELGPPAWLTRPPCLEGPLSEEYYRVRDVVYGQVRRGAVWTGRGQGGKGGRKGQEQGVSYRELPAVACQRRSTLTHSCNLLPAPTNASTTVPSVLIRRRRV